MSDDPVVPAGEPVPEPRKAGPRFPTRDVWVGIGIAALLDVVAVGLLLLVGTGIGLVGFGIVQMLWIVPAMLWYRKRRGVTLGIAIVAALGFLLNVTCWGIVLASFR